MRPWNRRFTVPRGEYARRWEQQEEAEGARDEPRNDEQHSAGDDEAAVDQIIRRHLTRGHLPTYAGDNAETHVLREPCARDGDQQ